MKGKIRFSVSICFIGLFLGFGLVNLVFGEIPGIQRKALIALYESTNGDNWLRNDNWKGDPGTENTWHGVKCDPGNTMVLRVELNNNNLSGTLPAELGDLSNLNYLNLASNKLIGTIPAELGKLSSLIELELQSNQLTGIPLQLAELSNLTHLKLDRNPLAESIPADLGRLTNLKELSLSGCKLKESIPPELGNLAGLEQLYLHGNCLSGHIPPELGNLSSLERLTLNGNLLLGKIPDEIDHLTNLAPGGSDFRWNALYTGSSELRNFLNEKQRDGGDWESTQTIAPDGVTAAAIDSASIRVSWDIIAYTRDPGGYLVSYGTTPDGPYTLDQITADKTVARVDVKNLSEDTMYYFVVKTQTGAHADNNNTVESENSQEVSEKPSGEITISGKVRTEDLQGVPGVTLTFSNNGGNTATDANGFYKKVINNGWTGRAIPEKAGCNFYPAYIPYTDVKESHLDQDYTAYVINLKISGRVTTQEGIGLQGVTMIFSGSEKSGSTETDPNGDYSFTVPYGWTGEVRPFKTGFNFDAPKSYTDITADKPGEDYIGKADMPVISGRVTSSGDRGVPGVTLTFSNGGGTAITGDNGDYIHVVNPGWSGTVTPYKRGYRFSPESIPYPNVQSDFLNRDYNAEEISTVISGRVEIFGETGGRDATGIGLPGVELTLSNGGEGTMTDNNGDYRLPVDYEWSGEVIPSKPGYNFVPKRHKYNLVTTNLQGENFEARAILPTISGRITMSTGGEGMKCLSEVSLEFSNNGGTTSTDDEGYYIHAVKKGWSGTVTPSKSGYTFIPKEETYNMLIEDKSHQDFKALHVNPIISGKATKADGTAVPDVILTFSHAGVIEGTATTNADGYYSHAVAYGTSGWTGTVAPSKSGYRFEPPQNSITDLESNIIYNYKCIPDIILTLKATRVKESTMAVSKYYGKLELTVQITDEVPVYRYSISRKKDNGEYEVIKYISTAEIPNGTPYPYNDTYLEKNKTYTYKAEARDAQGKVIMESNEAPI